jgi:hypothetical protein
MGMDNFLDALEIRDPQTRERDALTTLAQLVAHVKTAPGWAQILRGVQAPDIHWRNCR